MAYNYAYPVGYQPVTYQNPYGSTTPVPAPQNTGIIWVQGEAGAKSYLVAPNTTVQLWDSEDQVIYLKSADASGMPSMRILDYKERVSQLPVIETKIKEEPVSSDEFDVLSKQIESLKRKIERELKEIRESLEA